MPWLPSLSLPQPRKGCSDSGGTLARPEQAGQGCSSLREHSCCHPEGQADIPGHSQGALWALQGGRCLASSSWVMERGARGGQGLYSTALFWVTSVIKGWKDPSELLGGVLLLQNSGKGLLDAGAGKGKGSKDPAKHHILQTRLLWGLGNLFLSQVPQFPHLPARSVQGRGASLPSPLGELGVVWESRNSLSVNAPRLLQQGMRHLLECWPEGTALSQLHTAGISWGRLKYSKNKATIAHLPQVLSQEHK